MLQILKYMCKKSSLKSLIALEINVQKELLYEDNNLIVLKSVKPYLEPNYNC